MRALIVALLLTACAPPAPPAPPPASDNAPSDAPQDVGAETLALLDAGPLQTGQWTYRADEGVFAAGFGAPESEYQLTIACEAGSGQVTITSDHELAPDQETVLSIITASEALRMPAQSFNEGLPNVTAIVRRERFDGRAPWALLTTTQDRIGVEVAGDMRVYPWDEAIARALEPCN